MWQMEMRDNNIFNYAFSFLMHFKMMVFSWNLQQS